ncbi:MAG: hypothetical protein QY318_01140 [Candidatus Dojkabacteria bacterium]|nr:MAG: hypothetical protein QY318_01140 [Candidatus Dojkabacteria bacterium]
MPFVGVTKGDRMKRKLFFVLGAALMLCLSVFIGVASSQEPATITFLRGFMSGPWSGKILLVSVISNEVGLDVELVGCAEAVSAIIENMSSSPSLSIINPIKATAFPPLVEAGVFEYFRGSSGLLEISNGFFLTSLGGEEYDGGAEWLWQSPLGSEGVARNCNERGKEKFFPGLAVVLAAIPIAVLLILFFKRLIRTPQPAF